MQTCPIINVYVMVENGITLSNSIGHYLDSGSRLECMESRVVQTAAKEKSNKFII